MCPEVGAAQLHRKIFHRKTFPPENSVKLINIYTKQFHRKTATNVSGAFTIDVESNHEGGRYIPATNVITKLKENNTVTTDKSLQT